jgi:hypothetical protein
VAPHSFDCDDELNTIQLYYDGKVDCLSKVFFMNTASDHHSLPVLSGVDQARFLYR